ncbi:alanine racemase [bacterium]|nr:alanine racemase [bacterium]
MKRAWLEINQAQLIRNARIVKRKAKAFVWAVIKSFAYGHGWEVGRILDQEVDGFAVDNVEEAQAIFKFTSKPILVFFLQSPQEAQWCAQNKVRASIFDFWQFGLLKSCPSPLKVHLKIDTGMNRLGFKEKDWPLLQKELKKQRDKIEVEGIFSHLPLPEDKALVSRQKEKILEAKRKLGLRKVMTHLCASQGIERYGSLGLEGVRVGLLLYGYSEKLPVEPVLSFKTSVAQIKKLKRGEGLSYGLSWRAQKQTKIAVLPVGYKDGLPRALSGKGQEVLIKGQRVPLVGTICMRYAFADVSGLDVRVGEEVVLLGKQKNHKIDAREWARKTETIVYEILARLPEDLPREIK